MLDDDGVTDEPAIVSGRVFAWPRVALEEEGQEVEEEGRAGGHDGRSSVSLRCKRGRAIFFFLFLVLLITLSIDDVN